MASVAERRRQVLFSALTSGDSDSIPDPDGFLSLGAPERSSDTLTPLKELLLCMQEKRRLRDERQWECSRIWSWGSWAQKQRRSWRKALDIAQHLASGCRLWKKPLCEIEGRFGSGIHSFFTFLRFLVFLNLVAFALTMACVLLPTILFTNPTEETGDEGALIIGEDPQCVNRSAEEQWSSRGLLMYFVHFFTGQGFLQTSYLFYGHYKQRGISSSQFNISLSYLLSVLAYFLFCFAWITRQMVKEMIQKRMHSRDYRTRLSTKVFSGWDYCIRSTEAAVIKQHSISNDLKMDLEEEVRYLEKLKMTPLQKALLAITRTLVNVVILLLMAGAFYSIFLVTTISQDRVQRFSSEVRWSVLTEYLPPLILNLSTFLLPIAFAALVRLEGYTPNTEVNITLMRCVLLKLASLGMFLFSLGQKMLCFGQPKDPNCSACGYNKHYQCWETTLGQEMYKMTVFDFLCTLLLTLLVRLPRRLLVDKTSWRLTRWIGKEEFVLPLYILDIVAGQTVVWIGIFYCPLLPLLNSISLFVTFYLTKFNLCNLCKPSKKLFRASSSKFFFQFVLLLGLSLAVIPLLYNIFNSPPSQSCGLFANYPTAWHVVPKTMAASLPPVAQRIMNYAGSDAFALPLLIIFCLVLTVYISQDRAHRQTIRQLKAHLVMQAKDKRFLVEELSSAMRGSRQAL